MELGILITVKITETLQKKKEFLILVAFKITVFSQNGQVWTFNAAEAYVESKFKSLIHVSHIPRNENCGKLS